MRHLDLFSGIGGFALAASWVWPDHEVVAFCEREPFAQKVLAKHWPGVPCVDDIHNLKGDELGTVDLITGGFPCQPFSLAGKRKGSDDDRALWPEMCRVIQEARPTWVIGENVSGIIGVELDKVLSDLEGAGYEQQAFVVPACAKDAQHRRDRVWVVAHAEQSRTRDKDRAVAMQRRESPAKRTKTLRQGNRSALSNWADATGEAVAHPNGLRVERPRAEQQTTRACGEGEAIPNTMRTRREKPHLAPIAGGKGHAAGCSNSRRGSWPPEPSVGRVAHGIPNRVDRIKGLGNAIVPQVVMQFMQFIKIIELEHGRNVPELACNE